jgi:regulatory protein YycH of two-component signal transduction system YycFG
MFGSLRAISLSHVTHSENGYRGAYKARVFATGTISSFFATNMPNPQHFIQNSCLGCFRAISLPHVTHSENGYRGAYKARVFATGTISLFFSTNMPNPLLLVQTHVWGGFAQFRCRTSPITKTGIGCIQTQFLHTKHDFRNKHANPLV